MVKLSSNAEDQTLMTLYGHIYNANKLVSSLPTQVRERMTDRIADLLGRLQEAIIQYLRPTTIDDIRSYQPSLYAHGLAYLLDRHFRESSLLTRDFAAQLDEWKGYLWDDEPNAAKLLSDPKISTIEDVVIWFKSHRG